MHEEDEDKDGEQKEEKNDNREYKEEKVVELEEEEEDKNNKEKEEDKDREIVILGITGVSYYVSTIKQAKEVGAMRDQFKMIISTARKKVFLKKKVVKWFERVLFINE